MGKCGGLPVWRRRPRGYDFRRPQPWTHAGNKGEANGVISNLKDAIAKDAAVKSMAASDREFIKWFADANFQALVK